MSFPAENPDDYEPADPDDGLKNYMRRIREFPFLECSPELRAAVIVHAGRSLEEWRKTCKRSHVWEEVYVRLFRAWEDVQTYCKINIVSLPNLPVLLTEGMTLSASLSKKSSTYLEKYLDPLEWRIRNEAGKGADESDQDSPIEKLSRPLFCVAESIFLLPENLQKYICSSVSECGELPDGKLIEPFMQRWVTEDLSLHEHSLGERVLEARSLLVVSNTLFAVKHATTFQSDRVSLIDRIQDANLGLLKATSRFEPHRGFRFKTCAGWSIFSALQNGHKREEKKIYSLDANTQSVDSDSESFGNRLQYHMPDPEERAFQLALHDMFQSILETLSERERELVILRHGLEGGPPYNNKQIGEIFGITKERVRQLLVEGESRIIRQIGRRFPHLLPQGMTPQMAFGLADDRDAMLPKNRKKNHTDDALL